MSARISKPIGEHCGRVPNVSRREDTDAASAVEEIRRHVVGLFDAYLAEDRDALRRGRIPDWKGFQIRSTRLIRGVDAYMDELERVMGALRVERYEFLDFEVEVEGDIAFVYYLARDHLASTDPGSADPDPATVLIRSLDVYRRIDHRWVQAGSNICAVPDPSAHGATREPS